jgi:DNA-binding transcriptional regulator YhcF (GntR family)
MDCHDLLRKSLGDGPLILLGKRKGTRGMIIRIDKTLEDPLYLQIRAQIIKGIATGELAAGDALPSVRTLAQDLGINLHTVNKAYAVLCDDGYLLMRGRQGAFVADPNTARSAEKTQGELARVEGNLYELVLTYKALGGEKKELLTLVGRQADEIF